MKIVVALLSSFHWWSILLSSTDRNSTRPSWEQQDSILDINAGRRYDVANFALESGIVLPSVSLHYNTFGTINKDRDNVIVICHALTGNSRVDQWWERLIGPGMALDTSKYFVVCCNMLGSCYGSTGPTSIDPVTRRPFGMDFPSITIRDGVRLQLKLLRDHLNVRSIESVVGGSMGGMQAMEMAIISNEDLSQNLEEKSNFIRSALFICCNAKHSGWQIGISELQRQAIYSDPNWKNGRYSSEEPPTIGLSLARKMAMLFYRSATSYETKFGREINHTSGQYQIQSYLQHQGKKFLSRFDALTYVKLTELLDTHDVGRNRGGIASALRMIKCPTMVLGVPSDLLYPLYEQKKLAEGIPNSRFGIIDTIHGHDGFLLEQEQVGKFLRELLTYRSGDWNR